MAADAAGRSDASSGNARGQADGPLAVIAGSGELPGVIAAEVARSGREIFAIEVEGETDCDMSAYPHTRLPIGAAGRLKAALTEHGCRDVLMIGNFRRPRFSEIEWNMGTVKALSNIMRLKVGGDDAVVNGVVHIFESEGFRVVGSWPASEVHDTKKSLRTPYSVDTVVPGTAYAVRSATDEVERRWQATTTWS